MELPRISVILPVRNGRRHLERCLKSVGDQTYPNAEFIVVDGASSDGTLEVLRAHAREIDALVSEPDRGNYEAMNKGVRRATGDWLYFFGADDFLWDADVLARVAPMLAHAHPQFDVAYGAVMLINQEGEIVHRLGPPWEVAKRRFRDYMTLPHQGVFHHRSLFERHGLFNESFTTGGDYEFLLRELKDRDAHFMADVIVAGYRIGGGSSTPESGRTVLRETLRAHTLNGLLVPRPRWILQWIRTNARIVMWSLIGEKRARVALDWLRRHVLRKPAFWTKT